MVNQPNYYQAAKCFNRRLRYGCMHIKTEKFPYKKTGAPDFLELIPCLAYVYDVYQQNDGLCLHPTMLCDKINMHLIKFISTDA